MLASECIKGRRSIREFTNQAIPHELLEEIISVAAYAPSWKNTQITRYIAVEGNLKNQIADTCFSTFPPNGALIAKAPMLIAVTYVRNRSGYERDGSYSTSQEDRWQNFDTGIATEAFCLAAHERGIGSVILGLFDNDKIVDALGIPEDRGLSALIAIGYPATEPTAPKRKEVTELLTYQS